MKIKDNKSLENIIDELSPELTATIDGEAWQANIQASRLEGDKFIISGTSLSGESLVITALGSSEKTYELNLSSAQCAALYKESASDSDDDAYIGVTGTVVLSKVNTTQKSVSGTFSFTVLRGIDETIIISNGKFKDLSYAEGS